MNTSVETLTPAETAVVASVTLRDVNRIVDENLLPETLYGVEPRRFYADSCALIAFYFSTADKLTAQERSRTVASAASRLRQDKRWGEFLSRCRKKIDWQDCVIQEDVVSINLAPFLERACERLSRLFDARERVVKDPDILRGTPVIKGTRIPVYDVAASVSANIPLDRIRKAYPGLSNEDIELAALYAQANPLRGRPRRLPAPPAGAVILRAHRVPRRSHR